MGGRGVILALVAGSAMGCATASAPASGVRTTVERVVFDDEPTAARLRVAGPSEVTIGWRIDVAARAGNGRALRSVEWVYETVPAERAEAELAPPATVTARARLLAAQMQPAGAVPTAGLAAR